MNKGRRLKSTVEHNAMAGYLDRWRGFLEAAEILVDKLSPETFLQMHNEFHEKNIARLKKESEGAYGVRNGR